MENVTLIDTLQETVRVLKRVSDTIYAVENDLAGACPPPLEGALGQGESALALLAMARGLADTILHDAERVGQMIGNRSPVSTPALPSVSQGRVR